MVALVMLGILVFTIMIGFPVAFTLMALGVGFGYYAYFQPDQAFFDNRVFYLLTQNTFTVLNNDALVSIPLFLLMGYLVERANILDDLFKSLQIALKHVPGALAVATLATCALFATATGIVGAVVTLMGAAGVAADDQGRLRLAPGLRRHLRRRLPGHPDPAVDHAHRLRRDGRAVGGQALRGGHGARLLPGRHVHRLRDRRAPILKPERAPPLPKEEGNVPLGRSDGDAVQVLRAAGAADPVGAGRHHVRHRHAHRGGGGRRLRRGACWPSPTARSPGRRLRESVFLTARTSAMVCWLFVGSATFASIFAYLGGNVLIKEFVLGMNLNSVTFLLLSQAIIFVLGWPLEWTEIIIIFVPIFLPMLTHFGIDPILFGVLVALNLQTAFLSPPMAMSAYYLKGVSPPSLLLTQIFSGCMPFVYVVLVTMLLIYIFPGIALWLPNALYGR